MKKSKISALILSALFSLLSKEQKHRVLRLMLRPKLKQQQGCCFPADIAHDVKICLLLPRDPFLALFHLRTVSWVTEGLRHRARVTIVCESPVLPYFAMLSDRTGVIGYEREDLDLFTPEFKELVRGVREEAFSACFLLEEEPDTALLYLTAATGARLRAGFVQTPAPGFLNVNITGRPDPGYVLDRYGHLATILGLRPGEAGRWSISREASAGVRHLLKEHRIPEDARLLGIDLSLAGFGVTWLESLITRLVEETGFTPLLCAAPAFPCSDFHPVNGIPVVGDLTIGKCAALMGRCRVMLVGKTPLLHMAALLHTPHVGLFAADELGRYLIESPESKEVGVGADRDCLNQITAAVRAIAGRGRSSG